MTSSERLIVHLDRTFAGDPWHGSSLMTILEDVTASQAGRRPASAVHSIWELVRHIAAWKREVTRRLGGHPAGEPADGDWPPVTDTSEAAWAAALADLRAAHAGLLAAIARLDQSALNERVRDDRDPALGASLSRHDTIDGLIDHDVYHAGQVALVKRMVTGG